MSRRGISHTYVSEKYNPNLFLQDCSFRLGSLLIQLSVNEHILRRAQIEISVPRIFRGFFRSCLVFAGNSSPSIKVADHSTDFYVLLNVNFFSTLYLIIVTIF